MIRRKKARRKGDKYRVKKGGERNGSTKDKKEIKHNFNLSQFFYVF
jgi:hypothetical protein